MICNVFTFPCTVVVREFGSHCRLVKINPQVLMNVVFLYHCACIIVHVAPVLQDLGCRVLQHWMRVGLPIELMGCPVESQW